MSSIIVIASTLICALQAESATRFGSFREQVGPRVGVSFVAYAPEGRLLSGEGDMPPRADAGSARHTDVRGIAVAPDGALYVTWAGTDRVSVFRTIGGRTDERAFGRRGAGAGELREPGGLALDTRTPLRVLVADTLNHRVDVFGADGAPLASFGKRGSGDGLLDHPSDVAVDARGHAFVADLGNDRIVEFDAEGGFVRSFGGRGFHPGLFAAPSGLDVFRDQVFVADRDNHRVQVLGLDGQYQYEWGVHALLPREGKGKLHYPGDVAVSPSGKQVAVVEELEDRIQVFGAAGNEDMAPAGERDTAAHFAGMCSVRGDVLALLEPSGPAVSIFDLTRGTPIEITRFGRLGSSAGRMMRPSSVLLDATGEIVYVADPHASRISSFRIARKNDEQLRFDPQLARLVRSVDLASPTLPLRGRWTIEPMGLALGADGEVLVADQANARIVVFSPELVPLREYGVPVDPVGIAFDARTLRMFVTDPVSRALVIVARHGEIAKTVTAREARPFGVAVAPDGTVWVTERLRGALMKLVGDALVSLPARADAEPDGPRTGRGELFKPEGVACDGRGRVFVLEAGNHRFQIFDAQGAWLAMGGARFYTEAGRTPPPALVAHDWDGARSITTNGGAWRVLWRTKPAVVPRGQPFAIDAWVFAAGDPEHPAATVDLRVDAWMPDHLHGMNRVPRIVRRDDGGFTVEGMLFHMSGAWELDFDVVSKSVAERAQTRVDLE